jgi:uncharacterized membrane protein (DUF441 family)
LIISKVLHSLHVILFEVLKNLFRLLLSVLLVLLLRLNGLLNTFRLSNEQDLGIGVVEVGGLRG